jgi:flagellar biosynthesis/type III secretory pathway ATPase
VGERAPLPLEAWLEAVRRTDPVRVTGRVVQVVGLVAEARGPRVHVGEWLHGEDRRGASCPRRWWASGTTGS